MASGAETVTISHPDGPLEVPADAVLRLTEPLLGFPDRLEYVLLPTVRQGVWWFISVGEPSVTFVLVDPFVVRPEYGVDIGEAEQQALKLTSADDAFALVMLSLPPIHGEKVSANFRAPLVFNLREACGMQIMGRDESLKLQEEISLSAYQLTES